MSTNKALFSAFGLVYQLCGSAGFHF